MSKKVLLISTSLRAHSNSEVLADAFLAGAGDAGNVIEKISLKGKSLAFCKGCLSCIQTGKCVISDDAVEIAERMRNAEVIAFATPIYYYEMSGQMKTLLDRANSLYAADYAFREIYLLTSAADEPDSVPDRALHGLEGWIECFEGVTLAGSVFAGGVNKPGEIEGHAALKQAYEMGLNV